MVITEILNRKSMKDVENYNANVQNNKRICRNKSKSIYLPTVYDLK